MPIKDLLILIFLSSLSYNLSGQNAMMQQANSLMEQEKYEAAGVIYKELSRQYLLEKDSANYLNASLQLAISLDYMYESNQAVKILKEAIELSINSLGQDSLLALSYHKLALIYYLSLEEDELAISNWQKALKIRETIYPVNHRDIIKGYRNIGQSYLNLTEWEKGKTHFQKSLDLNLNRKEVDSLLLVKAYNYLGWVYTNLEDFNKAEKYFDLAKEKYGRFYSEEPWELYELYENISEFYRRRGVYSKVIETQKEILSIFQDIEDKWEGDYLTIANIYNNLGLGYDLMDSLEIALQQFEKSLSINKKYVRKNEAALAINYSNLSRLYSKKEDFKKAFDFIDKAILLDKAIHNKIGLANNISDKAIIYFKQRKIEDALKTIENAINLITLGSPKIS